MWLTQTVALTAPDSWWCRRLLPLPTTLPSSRRLDCPTPPCGRGYSLCRPSTTLLRPAARLLAVVASVPLRCLLLHRRRLLIVVVTGAAFRVRSSLMLVHREMMRHGGLWSLDAAVSINRAAVACCLRRRSPVPSVVDASPSSLTEAVKAAGGQWTLDTAVSILSCSFRRALCLLIVLKVWSCDAAAPVSTCRSQALLQSTFVGSSVVGCDSLLAHRGVKAAGGPFVVDAAVADKCTAARSSVSSV